MPISFLKTNPDLDQIIDQKLLEKGFKHLFCFSNSKNLITNSSNQITQVKDSLNGLVSENYSAGNFPVVSDAPNDQNSFKGCKFGQSNVGFKFTNFFNASYENVTIMCLKRGNVETVDPSLDVWLSTGTGNAYFAGAGTKWDTLESKSNSFGGSPVRQYMGLPSSKETHLETFSFGQGVRTFGNNVNFFERVERLPINLSGNLTIGNLNGGFVTRNTIYEILIAPKVISKKDLVEIYALLNYKYKFDISWNGIFSEVNLVCLGNSLTEGWGASTGGSNGGYHHNYPSQLARLLGGIKYRNLGVGGETLTQIQSRIATQVSPSYSNQVPSILSILIAASNDLKYNGSGTQDTTGNTAVATAAYNLLVTIFNETGAIGYKKIVSTELRRTDAGGVSNTAFEERRTIYNNLVANNWQNFADGFVGLRTITALEIAGSTDDLTLFADKVHLTKLGYSYVADKALPTTKTQLI